VTEGRAFTTDDLTAAIMNGAVERVRPKMMTVVAIMVGLLPILWSHDIGSEVMQRIAVPMIGGMVSSTLLTLVVVPVILPSLNVPRFLRPLTGPHTELNIQSFPGDVFVLVTESYKKSGVKR
jgi:Cu/Ag efflux pump CusA